MSSVRLLVCALAIMAAICSAQTTPQPSPPRPDPLMTQIRKSVAFLKLTCKDGDKEIEDRGTGFFVGFPDPRLPKDQSFPYLVTNRHVALCWKDFGKPLPVENISITLNRRQPNGDVVAQEVFLNRSGNAAWVFPQDESVDLAVLPFGPDPAEFDFLTAPFTMLADDDFLAEKRITEGQPIFFVGFFYQFRGTKRIEPIVRQGIIAMLPHEKVAFKNLSERVYLADAHVFGGNSGSPVFFNLGGYHEGALFGGDDYRLLGVINAEIFEDNNFNLEVTAMLQGSVQANSGVSTIVPAFELKALLCDPRLQELRNQAVNARGTQQR